MIYRKVTEVYPMQGYLLKLKFDNNQLKVFDMKKYLNIGRFKELTNIEIFNSVRVSFDSIEWCNGLDLDPELLFEKSKIIEE